MFRFNWSNLNMETNELLDTPSSEPALTKLELGLWQNKMLPLMQKMIIGLTIFFFIASLLQLIYLHSTILSPPEVKIKPTGFYN